MPSCGIRATRRTFLEAAAFAASLVAVGSGPAFATSRQGEAEVRLQSGQPLNGRSSDESDSTHGYVSKFCLAGDAVSGGLRVLPVAFGSRAWSEGVCR